MAEGQPSGYDFALGGDACARVVGVSAMKVTYELKVAPKAKRDSVKKEGNLWKVCLTAPAADGKANRALIGVLADYFNVRKSQIEIIKGLKSRHKTISIEPFTDHRISNGTSASFTARWCGGSIDPAVGGVNRNA